MMQLNSIPMNKVYSHFSYDIYVYRTDGDFSDHKKIEEKTSLHYRYNLPHHKQSSGGKCFTLNEVDESVMKAGHVFSLERRLKYVPNPPNYPDFLPVAVSIMSASRVGDLQIKKFIWKTLGANLRDIDDLFFCIFASLMKLNECKIYDFESAWKQLKGEG